jgi:hypothetical protein
MKSKSTSGEMIDPRELGLHIHGRSGQEFIVRCPFHGDKNPSACFNPVSGMFFCFSCGAASDASRLAYLLGGHVVTKAWSRRRDPTIDWRGLLGSPVVEDHPYLRRRRVTNDQAKRWRIGQSPGAVVIPVTNADNHDVGVVVRREQGQPRYMFFGEKVPLWPLGWLMEQAPGTRIYVVEGVFGKLRAERAGINAVAVMGASVKAEAADYLRNFEVVGLFDDDFAGYAGAGRLLSLLPMSKIVLPGREADEMTKAEWRDLDAGITSREIDITRSLTALALRSGDASRFHRQLPSGRKNKGVDRVRYR